MTDAKNDYRVLDEGKDVFMGLRTIFFASGGEIARTEAKKT
jgi:hypothetical protein